MKTHNQQKRSWKFVLIIVASTILAILLHQLHDDPLMHLKSKPQSILITSGWFPPIAFIALAFTFGVMGCIFLGIQKTFRGTKLWKGGVFGLAMSGLWIIGMTEAYVLFPVSLFGEIYTGIADSCGILLMSLLIGKYWADDTLDKQKHTSTTFPAIVILSVIYVIVRYFSYAVLEIESSYITRPLATFLWTAGMGGWIGIMYRLVSGRTFRTHPLKHAAVFGGLVFGVTWILFNLFALLFIATPVLDLVYRSFFDSLAVILGAYISSMFHRRYTE